MNQAHARSLVAITLTVPFWLTPVVASDFGLRNLKGIQVCTDEASVQAQDNTDMQDALLTAIRAQLHDGAVTTLEGACRARRDALYLLLNVDYQIAAAFSTEVALFDLNAAGYPDGVKVYARGSFGRAGDAPALMEFVLSDFVEFIMDWREQNSLPTNRLNRQS
ncbi:hypothetical protein [Deinococcus yavapaiensis]|uniref:Uncharacterized protein n=1 Tax=Deinococcus yavapaiensis KR-236 TaxID=694435 RepID=A0A318RYR7_9DEIO|nr:hypothetical protein [Deinococcus yavapaiensis]PYE48369.1 hypothetical protein DES52_13012 [Deinococcus yavapaiensis KR-236]